MPVNQSHDEQRLLKRVEEWFEAPKQVELYRQQVPSGLTSWEEWLLQSLPSTGKTLDIGCGAGRITLELARRGYEAVGIDVSSKLIEAAIDLASQASLAPHFLVVKGLTLPFAAQSFDAALAIKLYGYIPGRKNRLEYLEEIYRVLRPGAPLLFTYYVVPPEAFMSYTEDDLHTQAAANFTTLEPGDTFCAGQGYAHWFTPEDLQSELTQSHFSLETFRSNEGFGGDGFLYLAVLRKPAA
jgi:SAM-dependent methyltransferase